MKPIFYTLFFSILLLPAVTFAANTISITPSSMSLTDFNANTSVSLTAAIDNGDYAFYFYDSAGNRTMGVIGAYTGSLGIQTLITDGSALSDAETFRVVVHNGMIDDVASTYSAELTTGGYIEDLGTIFTVTNGSSSSDSTCDPLKNDLGLPKPEGQLECFLKDNFQKGLDALLYTLGVIWPYLLVVGIVFIFWRVGRSAFRR